MLEGPSIAVKASVGMTPTTMMGSRQSEDWLSDD